MTEKDKQKQIPELLTVNQFVARFPAFTAGGIRYYIFQEAQNGLAKAGAVVRVGKKVLIDVVRFFEWVDAQNPNRKSSV